jgi:anti-sigma factor RsiW
VAEPVTREQLMRYLDGEVTPEERREIEAAVADSPELQHELASFRGMKEDMGGIVLKTPRRERSVWDDVDRKLTRPFGWLLILAGSTAWVAYGTYIFFTSPIDAWEKLATSAIVIGILLLLASVIGERYRDWLTDPYRDIQR